jgi:hypothetical protein
VNQELFKNRKFLIGAVAVIVLLLAGAFLVFRGNSVQNVNTVNEVEVLSLSPEDVGMKVTVREDKRAVMFELEKAEGITKVDYEIHYTHDVDGQRVQEGLLGEMNIAEDGITKTDFRPFGTCSATCRYDEDVADVVIYLKIEKEDGKIYEVEQPVEL